MENRYDKYKDSGVEWIGEIPEHWNSYRIKYHFSVISGSGFKNEIQGCTDGEIPVCKASDISNAGKEIFKSSNYLSREIALKEGFNIIPVGSILFPKIGEAMKKNNRSIAMIECCLDNNCQALIPSNINCIYSYYVFKMIDMSWYDNGGTIPSINNQKLINSFIPYPPFSEQQSIAAYLDQKCGEIDELITLQEKMITKLQSYKQSVITEAVTKGLDKNVPLKDSGVEWIGEIPKHWVVKRLKYVCDFNPQNDQSISKLSEVGYLPMERLKNGYMLPSVISVSNLTQGLTFFKENDIVLAKVTPCFENGNIAIAKNLVNNCGFGSSELFVFRVKSINRKYLFYLLQEGKIKDVCKSTMIGTGGLKRISPIFMKNIQLPIPSLSEQQSIADYLDQRCSEIDELISIKQQKIEKLKEYKKSLIFECVTGKRKVS